MIKNWIHILTATVLLAAGYGCGSNMPDTPDNHVVIIYDNDVHCAVEGYAAVAALKEKAKEETPYVTTVSCGDFAQGDIIGTFTNGEGAIEIMNRTGYDLATLGNHEFDYGMEQHYKLTDMLDAEVICANFTDLQSNVNVYKPYRIVKYGKTDIAFIGIATPATATSVSPKTFHNADGEIRYSFLPQTLFATIQNYADEARSKGADYVVALSHLGIVKDDDYPTSLELIAVTTGIDAVLDGHSHSVIPDCILLNREGKEVLLSSSGSRFENIGILTLSKNGKFSASLVETSAVASDSLLKGFIGNVKQNALEKGNKIIGKCDEELDALDDDNEWLVRDREMPLGNFCADAFRVVLNTDIAMINGGGIRANLPAGEITLNSLVSVFPFNNTACTAAITGAQLMDALEVAVMSLPEKSGSFMQVSGIRMTVDTSVPSPVVKDTEGLFSHIGNGKRRVSNVQVMDKTSGKWIAADMSRTYTLSSINYNITGLGSDGIFRYTHILHDNQGQDVEILAKYLEILGGNIGKEYNRTQGRILK